MKNRNLLFLSIISLTILVAGCKTKQNQGNVTNRYQQKVDSLIKIMTLDEKIGQLNLLASGHDVTGPVIDSNYREMIKQGKVGAILNASSVDFITELQKLAVENTRLGIPLIFGLDVIHGFRTIFPIPLGQASSWDLPMIEQSERIAATEATAEGVNWTFSPMVDVARDPRWGRVSEGSGEDTWLGGQIGAARVRGFQGDDLSKNNTLLGCVKHFAAYGAPQAGREYNTVDMSERSLMEWYMPPYKACVDAGVATIMSSFNEIGGIPSTSNKWLMTDLLRNQWGFKGFVVTDYTSINELVNHGVASDLEDAGYLALKAGIDMDMQGSVYVKYLSDLVKKGKISEEEIDRAVSVILLEKYKLGSFDDPYRYCNKDRVKTDILTPESRAFSRDFAAKSCVLLKNQNQTLPVPSSVKSIAVIGPLADSKQDMLGNWAATGKADDCITLLEGIKNYTNQKNISVRYAMGCDVSSSQTNEFAEALKAARSSDFVILALGEKGNMSGEAASRTHITLPGVQSELAKQIIKTGKPVVVVLFNGRPLAIPELDETASAILETWFAGTEAGNGIADILFGTKIPSGKLTMTFPRNEGQIPIFYNAKNTGRPFNRSNPDYKYQSKYIDCSNDPLYPFGYGLSYTSFNYSNLTLNKTEINQNDSLQIKIDVTNAGNYDGEEVVQLYTHDLVGSVTRPLKELKNFKKVFIKKDETKTVEFSLSTEDLKFYDINMNYVCEPGDFEVTVGSDSRSGLTSKFTVK